MPPLEALSSFAIKTACAMEMGPSYFYFIIRFSYFIAIIHTTIDTQISHFNCVQQLIINLIIYNRMNAWQRISKRIINTKNKAFFAVSNGESIKEPFLAIKNHFFDGHCPST
jgi:hypothetical protein